MKNWPVILMTTGLLLVTLTACTSKANTLTTATESPSVTSTPSPTTSPTASPSASPSPTIKSTPKISTAPLIKCVGPDGKTIKMTQKACNDFNKAWNKASTSPSTSTAAQVTGCASYNPTGNLSTARVSVKIESGQTWVGQAAFDFTQKYAECKGNGLDYGYKDIISGETTHDFGGLRPGPYKVEVLYHGKNWSKDVDLNGGTTEVTITVSNN